MMCSDRGELSSGEIFFVFVADCAVLTEADKESLFHYRRISRELGACFGVLQQDGVSEAFQVFGHLSDFLKMEHAGTFFFISGASVKLHGEIVEDILFDHMENRFDITGWSDFYKYNIAADTGGVFPVIYSKEALSKFLPYSEERSCEEIFKIGIPEDGLADATIYYYEPSIEVLEFLPMLKRNFNNSGLYPTGVAISTSEVCNLKCRMCHAHSQDFGDNALNDYYSFYKRHYSNGMMSIEDFSSIVDQVKKSFPAVKNLYLSGTGEPILNKHLPAFLEILTQSGYSSSLTTNATLLRKEIAEQLFKAGLNHIDISLDAFKPETYSEIRGGDLSKVLYHIESCMESANKYGVKTMVNMTLQNGNIQEMGEFTDFWINKVDMVGLWNCHLVKKFRAPLFFEPYKKVLCKQIFSGLVLSSDGHSWTCCGGGPVEGNIGNWKEAGLADLWTSDRLVEWQDRMLDGESGNIPMCRECEVWLLHSLMLKKVSHDRVELVTPGEQIVRKIRK